MQILATLLLLFISVANAFHKLSSRISQIAFGKADEAVEKQAVDVARSSSSAVVPARSSNSKRLKLIGVTQEIDGLTGAFIGGTVGVMSMAILVELRVKADDEQLASCPYCMGNGEILCASCFGNCTAPTANAVTDVTCYCDVCSGRGLIQCVNCKGDGRETPIIFKSKAVRDPEYAADGISIDSPSII